MAQILVFGDSITYGSYDLEYGGWVYRLRRFIDNNIKKEDYCVVYNLGIDGDSSEGVFKRMIPETESILNAARISKIKKGALVVNTAPMELLDLKAMDKRLTKGDIAFIFEHTDLGDLTGQDLKMLQKHKNCITYPPLGYISNEARIAKQDIFITNMENYLNGKSINVVN